MLDGRLDDAAHALAAVAPRAAALAPTSSLPARVALARGTVARLRGDAARRAAASAAAGRVERPSAEMAARAHARMGADRLVELEQGGTGPGGRVVRTCAEGVRRLETRPTPARADAHWASVARIWRKTTRAKACRCWSRPTRSGAASIRRAATPPPPLRRWRAPRPHGAADAVRTVSFAPASGMAGFDRPSASSRAWRGHRAGMGPFRSAAHHHGHRLAPIMRAARAKCAPRGAAHTAPLATTRSDSRRASAVFSCCCSRA